MRRLISQGTLDASKGVGPTARTGPIPLSTVGASSRRQVSASVPRLSHMLNKKIMGNSLILIKKSPKVNGSALLLRIYQGLSKRGLSMLCISKRRSLRRVGLHTRQVNAFDSRLRLLYRADLSAVHAMVRQGGPRVIIVSDVRAVCGRGISSTPNDISRIHRSANILVRVTGKVSVSVFVIKRIAGRKIITNPHMLRRVISAILCFRKSHRRDCQVLHNIGGHFNSAGRVNIFRVHVRKLIRIRGPSRCVLDNGPGSTSNSIITYSVRNAHPVLLRVRTLVYRDCFGGPEEATAKASFGHIGLLVTILRGHVKVRLSSYSTCMGVTNKVHVGRPTVSLKVILTVVSDGLSLAVSRGAVYFNRIKLDKRIHNMDVTRRHITRTTGLNFRMYVLPGMSLPSMKGGCTVGLVKITGIERTLSTVRT